MGWGGIRPVRHHARKDTRLVASDEDVSVFFCLVLRLVVYLGSFLEPTANFFVRCRINKKCAR